MSKVYTIGVLGCGDFLRWNVDSLKQSGRVAVKWLFDPEQTRAETYAKQLGGQAADSAEAIFRDADIDLVLLFVPPWIRRGQIEAAAAAGKHILTTKPLGANIEDCTAMVQAVAQGSVRCGVMYRRTGDAGFETLRRVFESGEIGQLALYKQDWLHHYPQWNDWALDPARNGGPFMDAMIHNLNVARYLMGPEVVAAAFFGEKLAHDLPCNDTESLRVQFAGGGLADLFITWAADLEVTSAEGNYREHIDALYMVTDQGWYVTEGKTDDGAAAWTASKDGRRKQFPVEPIAGGSVFDRFARAIEQRSDNPPDLCTVREAYEDIKILKDAEGKAGHVTPVDLSVA